MTVRRGADGIIPYHVASRLCPPESSIIAALQAEILALKEQLEPLKGQLEQLQAQVDWFKRQRFGEKSEKRHLLDTQS